MIFNGEIKNNSLSFEITPEVQEFLNRLNDKDITIEIKKKTNTRTSQQNKALHLWFTLLADELNSAGFDMKKLIRKEIDIPWTSRNVKEYIFRPVMKAYLGTESTKDLKTTDIDKIFDIINRVLAERTGLYLPFPSINYFNEGG